MRKTRLIKGFNGLYSATSDGKIISERRKFFLKPTLNRKYYYMVDLRINGERKMSYVHRLVAQTFIPNPKNKPQVNHKDGDKLNNCVSNLEWVTHSEQRQHAWDTGLQPRVHKESTKLKISKSRLGQAVGEETKKKISKGMKKFRKTNPPWNKGLYLKKNNLLTNKPVKEI